MKRYFFDVIPMPKPRMTYRDKWKGRPIVKAYFHYKDELGWVAKAQKYPCPDEFKVVFHIPVPKSWTKKKKKKLIGKPHQQRPDYSNYLKGFEDILYEEDSSIWHVDGKKIWCDEGAGGIEVFV